MTSIIVNCFDEFREIRGQSMFYADKVFLKNCELSNDENSIIATCNYFPKKEPIKIESVKVIKVSIPLEQVQSVNPYIDGPKRWNVITNHALWFQSQSIERLRLIIKNKKTLSEMVSNWIDPYFNDSFEGITPDYINQNWHHMQSV